MTQSDALTVRDRADAGRFEAVDVAGTVAGIAVYQRRDDVVVFTHTEVEDAYEGQGIGSQLVRAALDAVREEGLRVLPRCPFVRTWIDRHPGYADLVT